MDFHQLKRLRVYQWNPISSQMAKQLPAIAANDPAHLLCIYSSLHQAHHHLSNFLFAPHQTPPPSGRPPSHLPPVTSQWEVGDGGGDCDEGTNSEDMVDMIEERMRDFFIKNKRPKRWLSLSAVAMTVAEERRVSGGDGDVRGLKDYFDAHGSKLRALELVYQFHG